MLIKILKKDLLVIEVSPMKLNRPYIDLINGAIQGAEQTLEKSNQYLSRQGLQVIRQGSDKNFTTFLFQRNEQVEVRPYANVSLRNRTEALMKKYFTTR